MFAGYLPDRRKKKDDEAKIMDEDGEIVNEEEYEQKRIMNQQRSLQNLKDEDRRKSEIKESLEYRPCAPDSYSDDSEELEMPAIKLPARYTRKEVQSVMPQNKSWKQKRMEQMRNSEVKPEVGSSYGSFPSGSSKRSSDEEKPDIWSKNKKRNRSRSRERESFPDKKKQKKKHKRRYHYSSSSDSSSSGSSRSRSKSYRKSSPTPQVKAAPKQKWSFISDEEFRHLHLTYFGSWIQTSRQQDFDNVQLGMPKREMPKYRNNFRFIEGLETKSDDRNKFYKYFSEEFPEKAKEIMKKEKEKPFYAQLLSLAKHVPQETKFRKKFWSTDSEFGFVPLSQEPLEAFEYQSEQSAKLKMRSEIEDEFRAKRVYDYDDSLIKSITDLETRGKAINMQLSQEPQNVNLWIDFIDLQDKIYEAKKIHAICDSRKSFLERKYEILARAIERNRANVQLQLMKIDLLIEMQQSSETVLVEFKRVTHNFPHIPLAWNKFLDYVQFDSNVYTFSKMESIFDNCLEKLRGLVDGTLQSHVPLITDHLYIRKYQLFVYIRYLKWLMNCGCVSHAIANIQATFEINFGYGLNEIGLKTHRERMNLIKTFWKTKLPRIGDKDARGAIRELERAKQLSENDIEKMEFEQYDIDLYGMKNEIDNQLRRNDRSWAENWVNFERNMANFEARCKRNPVEIYAAEYQDELGYVELSPPVESEELRIYYHPPDETEFDFVQPLLELLGSKFSVSTNYWCTSEELFESWRDADPENQFNFDRIPTYTENFCRKLATNIIDYLVRYEFIVNRARKIPQEKVMKLLIASILTKSSNMERNRENEIWKLQPKELKIMLNEVLTPYGSIIQENPIIGKVLPLFAVKKYLEWYRIAKQKMAAIKLEIENCKQRRVLTSLYLDEDDEKRMNRQIVKTVHKILQEFSPLWTQGSSQIGPNVSLADIQIHLFAVLLRLNMTSSTQRELCLTILAPQILEVPLDQIDMQNIELIKTAIFKLRDTMELREKREQFSMISVLPKPSVVCRCFEAILKFTMLGTGENEKIEIGTICQNSINFINTLDLSKENEIIDGKLIMDQLLNELTETKERKTLHLETYKKVLQQALKKFRSEIRYSRKYVDDMTSSTAKKIELQKNLNAVKERFYEMRRCRFDPEVEVNLQIISMVRMYGALKIYMKNQEFGSIRSLLKQFEAEAVIMNESTFWRLAQKIAAKIEGNRKELIGLHVRANGFVGWARNLHIDRIEVQPTDTVLEDVLQLMEEKAKGAPESSAMIISDHRMLQTICEIHQKKNPSSKQHQSQDDNF